MERTWEMVIAEKEAELAALKIRFEAADTMNHELHKINTELQKKLAYETKRADAAEKRISEYLENNPIGEYGDGNTD